jgi:hypothetical protein
MIKRGLLLAAFFGGIFSFVSCGAAPVPVAVAPTAPSPTPVTTTSAVNLTASSQLASRILADKSAVPLDATATLSVSYTPKPAFKATRAVKTPTFTLVGTVNAPVVDGITLGATGVAIRGDYAFVSYNAPGVPAKGAVQVVKFDGNGTPTVISEVVFASRDVNAVTVCGNDLYLALASPSLADAGATPTFGTGATHGAAIGKVTLDSQLKFSSASVSEVVLESYAANSISCSDAQVIATDGSTGGLGVFDRNLSARSARVSFSDARSAAFYGANSYAALYGGTGGQTAGLAVVQNGAVVKTVSVGGATIPESKSVVTIVGDLALAALNDGGVKMANLATGATVFSISAPAVAGLSSSVTVSNSVSAYKNLVLIANGEAGVYVGQLDTKIESGPKTVSIIGRLDLGQKISANDIKIRTDKAFIAAGIGGFKILSVYNPDYDAEIQTEKQTDINSTDKN